MKYIIEKFGIPSIFNDVNHNNITLYNGELMKHCGKWVNVSKKNKIIYLKIMDRLVMFNV